MTDNQTKKAVEAATKAGKTAGANAASSSDVVPMKISTKQLESWSGELATLSTAVQHLLDLMGKIPGDLLTSPDSGDAMGRYVAAAQALTDGRDELLKSSQRTTALAAAYIKLEQTMPGNVVLASQWRLLAGNVSDPNLDVDYAEDLSVVDGLFGGSATEKTQSVLGDIAFIHEMTAAASESLISQGLKGLPATGTAVSAWLSKNLHLTGDALAAATERVQGKLADGAIPTIEDIAGAGSNAGQQLELYQALASGSWISQSKLAGPQLNAALADVLPEKGIGSAANLGSKFSTLLRSAAPVLDIASLPGNLNDIANGDAYERAIGTLGFVQVGVDLVPDLSEALGGETALAGAAETIGAFIPGPGWVFDAGVFALTAGLTAAEIRKKKEEAAKINAAATKAYIQAYTVAYAEQSAADVHALQTAQDTSVVVIQPTPTLPSVLQTPGGNLTSGGFPSTTSVHPTGAK